MASSPAKNKWQDNYWRVEFAPKERLPLMLRSIEAIVEKDGEVHLKESVRLGRACRAIVTIIDEPWASETALLSEPALAEDWNRPEEDEAWSHLQQTQASLS
jgi:hypothetical protein